MVLAMGIISLAGIAVIWGVPIIFGIIGWVMGQTDLRKMKNNQMDPDGQGMTKAGWVCSIIGTLLNGAMILFCAGFIGFVIWGESANRPRTTRSAVPFTVPAKQQMNKDWNPNPPGQRGSRSQTPVWERFSPNLLFRTAAKQEFRRPTFPNRSLGTRRNSYQLSAFSYQLRRRVFPRILFLSKRLTLK